MNHARIVKCTSCDSLHNLYNEIECTLLDLIKKKWANAQYNTSLYFNQQLYDRLLVYKRIVYRRMFNPTYPMSTTDVQDIIKGARLLVYKPGSCSQCTDCFPAEDTSSSTTFTTTTTTIG